jgi:O-antigen/teichoic acid export membrane protein
MNQRVNGALLSYVSLFINIGIALAFTPFLLSSLGQSEYGLFNIIGSFAAYLIILDMGINDSVIRYLIHFREKGNMTEERNFLAISIIVYFFLATFVALFGVWLYLSVDAIFNQTLSILEINSLKTMTIIIITSSVLTIGLNPITAYITTHERFAFLTLLRIGSHIITTFIIVVFLIMGYKAIMVVAVTALMNLVILFYKLFYAYKHLNLRIKLYRFDFVMIKDLLTYSAPIFVNAVTEQIYWKLDNILLGSMVGASIVAVYAIGIMFHKYFMSFGTAISKIMVPKIIKQVERGADSGELLIILTRVSRVQAIIVMPILIGIILYGRDFLLLWLGEGYGDAYYIMLLILIPYSLELIGNIRNVFLEVKRLFWYRVLVIFFISLLNIVVTIYAIKNWGIIGAAASTGGALILGYLAVSFILWFKLKINMFKYWLDLSRGILLAVSTSLILGLIFSYNAGQSWLSFIVHISVYTLIYSTLIWFIALDDKEKKQVKTLKLSLIGKLQKKQKIV